MNARLKSRLERLESHAMQEEGECQVIEIQFISPEKMVTRAGLKGMSRTVPPSRL